MAATPQEQLREDMKGVARILVTKEKELNSRIAKGKFLQAGEKDPEKIEQMQEWEAILAKHVQLYEAARAILEQSGIFIQSKDDIGFMYVTKIDEKALMLVRTAEDMGAVVVNFTSLQESSGPVTDALAEDLLI